MLVRPRRLALYYGLLIASLVIGAFLPMDAFLALPGAAKVILSCDKALCPKTSDKRIKVLYTLNNTGPLKKVAPPCPKKGVIGKDQKACVDYEQSFRRDGDLYLPVLFARDYRGSCC